MEHLDGGFRAYGGATGTRRAFRVGRLPDRITVLRVEMIVDLDMFFTAGLHAKVTPFAEGRVDHYASHKSLARSKFVLC